jgi:peptidyl-prolyl cis-trans isomerase D
VKNYIDEVKVEPESVREFFDENKQAFLEPQKVKVDFIELSTKEIAKSIKVNDKEQKTLNHRPCLLSLYLESV